MYMVFSGDGHVNHAGVGCVKWHLQEREHGVADGQGNGHWETVGW